MMIRAIFLSLALAPAPAAADTVVAARTIRAQTIISVADVTHVAGEIIGTYVSPEEVVGLEARNVLYAGRPIRIEQLGPPAIIDRNQIVTLVYKTGGLSVAAEGRALARVGVGDSVRVMNLSSRQTVTGIVHANGTIDMSPPQFPTASD